MDFPDPNLILNSRQYICLKIPFKGAITRRIYDHFMFRNAFIDPVNNYILFADTQRIIRDWGCSFATELLLQDRLAISSDNISHPATYFVEQRTATKVSYQKNIKSGIIVIVDGGFCL